MAALNFPSSPALNQVYSANGYSWKWNGASWISLPTINGGTINGTSIGATTPSTGAFTTLTTTGNTGIGTPSPNSRLDVRCGAISAGYGGITVGTAGTNYSGTIRLEGTSAPTFIQNMTDGVWINRNAWYNGAWTNVDSTVASWLFNLGTSDTAAIWRAPAASTSFTKLWEWNSNGAVGYGTLNVVGTSSVFDFQSTGAGVSTGRFYASGGPLYLDFRADTSGANTSHIFRLYTGGTLGPQLISSGAAQDFNIYTGAGNVLALSATSGGHVGIGGSPISLTNATVLTIGKGSTSVNEVGVLYIRSGNGGGGSRDFSWEGDGSGSLVLKDRGYNGANNGTGALIGIPYSGSIRFYTYGAGTLVTDASGNITASSDGRMKDVLGTFDRGLAAVCGITPQLFKWNAESGLDTEAVNAGFIAQDVLPHIPEAIHEKNDRYSMSDRPLIAALVNAVKELKALNDALVTRVTKLENKA